MVRYTSPETSKLLAEAGLEQNGEMIWCACACASFDKSFRVKNSFHVCRVYSTRPGQSMPCLDPSHVRALDLTDVLHELTRPRPEEKDARPLCETWHLQPAFDLHGAEAYVFGAETHAGGIPASRWATSPAEAAGQMLLALLKERKP